MKGELFTMDFIRFLHGPLLSTLGALLVVWLLATVLLKNADDEMKPYIRKGRNWVTALILLALAWFAFSAATVNEVPRKVIDRSVANERAKIVEEQGREASEAAKKGAEEKR
jgi:hypothetical protein